MSVKMSLAPNPTLTVWPFPHVRRIGDTLYVGLQLPTDDDADIETQTHESFGALANILESEGSSMQDLMKLHTYYVYEGEGGRDVTEYWERMTDVRMQYIADPGPAATALRIKGVYPSTPLIACDGIAELGENKKRIMPDHAWDWSMKTTLSQGWLVNDEKIYVGGQLSADRTGAALNIDDVIPQAQLTLDYIHHVLLDSGSDWHDVVSIKIAYQYKGDEAISRELLAKIEAEVKSHFPNAKPVLIPFGVNLLYEGLVLEIDAIAIKGGEKKAIQPQGSINWKPHGDEFELAYQVNNEVYLGGISAPGGASLEAQLETSMSRIGEILNEVGSNFNDLAKINVYVYSTQDKYAAGDMQTVIRVLQEFLSENQTVVSIVRVATLPRDGQRVQVDGVAVINASNL
ncbi:RidA family protein [Acinetobacter haemolyticus]|uniref:RidA family protein n=1 Tax=Acinetobacter haemolyticus TaxID=29430 RepID=UPI000F73CDA8|nr:RidA family protein [Acinetobacter haemolyticus]MCU4387329.1 RidA family protein [Acinetobacter haemolyticus]RSN74766.1 RidA family protein [Acinetobacter haemolyticus]